MALARIFSYSPEQATALIQDLERQGYTVEVIRPEETPSTPADLEIQYELCEPGKAINLAKDLAAEFDADVAVESGALSPPVERLGDETGQPTEALVSENLEMGTGAPGAPIMNEPTGDVWMDMGVEMEEDGPTEPQYVAYRGNESIAQERVDLPLAELAGDETREELPQSPGVWSRGATALVASLGNLRESLRALWQAGLQRMREQRERAAIHSAEVRARREQRLLELTCRRAEALQRSKQIESARRAAAGYVSQLERETGATGKAESAAGEGLGSSYDSPRASKTPIISWWTPSQHVKSIAAGAAAAGALFALTLGISAVRSKPASAPSPVSPAAPPVASPQVTVKTNSIAPHGAAKPSASETRRESGKPASSAARAEIRAQAGEEDDSVGDDVVVRHFSQPQQNLQTQNLRRQVPPAVKRYSDTDN